MSQTYAEFLGEKIQDWTCDIVRRKQPPSLDDILATIDLGQDNGPVMEWAVGQKICTKGEWGERIKKQALTVKYGFVPTLARHLVDHAVGSWRLRVTYGGQMLSDRPVQHPDDAGRPLAEEEARADWRLWSHYLIAKAREYNLERLKRDLRLLRDEDRIAGIADTSIADSVDAWFDAYRERRLPEIHGTVRFDRSAVADAEPHWAMLQEAGFGREHPPGFVAGVLRKFIWQVKRKMLNLPVTNHLMPILSGPQGKGKSTFLMRFLRPMEEVAIPSDFKQITDDRNIDLWRNYVVVMDEMSYATRADMENTKFVITAASLSRRPMRTNSLINIRQNATFIGCSNKILAQLIQDETGLRRFVELHFVEVDWEILSRIDPYLLWRSVDETAEDPSLAIMEQIREQQEENRMQSPVEVWLEELARMLSKEPSDFRLGAAPDAEGWVYADKLWLLFQEWAVDLYPDHRMNADRFKKELARLVRHDPAWEKKRKTAGMTWRWSGWAAAVPAMAEEHGIVLPRGVEDFARFRAKMQDKDAA
jgi:hypothetical protein